MKCQIQFSGKNKKNIINLSSAENAQRVVKVKPFLYSKTGVYRGIFYFSYFRSKTYEAVLTSTHNLCFEHKYEKYQNFLSETFHFLLVKISVYLNRHVFVMGPC